MSEVPIMRKLFCLNRIIYTIMRTRMRIIVIVICTVCCKAERQRNIDCKKKTKSYESIMRSLYYPNRVIMALTNHSDYATNDKNDENKSDHDRISNVVQYNIVQYSTVQYSTVQYSTVQYTSYVHMCTVLHTCKHVTVHTKVRTRQHNTT